MRGQKAARDTYVPTGDAGDVNGDTPPRHRLLFPENLPYVGDHLHWSVRARLRKRAIRYFGELLWSERATLPARVMFIRIQGPRQHVLDNDNLPASMKGLRDALKHCGYIVDDSPKWGTFDYIEDRSRRNIGPAVEVFIWYD